MGQQWVEPGVASGVGGIAVVMLRHHGGAFE
jgi:hypothetical protein